MDLLSPRLNKYLFYWIVITLSVSPAFATDPIDNRNYMLIGSMFLGPIIVIFSNKFIPPIDIPIATIIVLMFVFQWVFIQDGVKWSSILFSCMYYTYFAAAVRVFLRSSIRMNFLLKFIERIIYAYVIVLLIQQFCVLTGLPVFNQLWGFGEHNPWKLNSLSAEPSHTSRYIGILMYAFIRIQDVYVGRKISFKKSFRINKKVWLSFFWVMITSMSGTAMIIIVLVLCKYLKKKNIVLFAMLIVCVFAVGLTSEFVPLKRATTFLESVTTGDANQMVKADHSASVRVLPVILSAQHIDIESKSGWVGAGVSSSARWMYKYVPGVPYGFTGGGVMNNLLECGIIVGLLFIIFTLWCCVDHKYRIPTIGLWIMCIAIDGGVNTQIGWLCILMLFLSMRIKRGLKKKSILKIN